MQSNSDNSRNQETVLEVSRAEATKKSLFRAGSNLSQISSQGTATTVVKSLNTQTQNPSKEIQNVNQMKHLNEVRQDAFPTHFAMLSEPADKEVLLTKQVEQYGVNMYDSLNQHDDFKLSAYMDTGYSRDEATLIIFEEKFGRVTINPEDRVVFTSNVQLTFEEQVELDQLVMQGYSQQAAVNFILSRRVGAIPAQTQMPLSVEDEAAIQRLMNLGYSFEQAMRMHFEVGGLQHQIYNTTDAVSFVDSSEIII